MRPWCKRNVSESSNTRCQYCSVSLDPEEIATHEDCCAFEQIYSMMCSALGDSPETLDYAAFTAVKFQKLIKNAGTSKEGVVSNPKSLMQDIVGEFCKGIKLDEHEKNMIADRDVGTIDDKPISEHSLPKRPPKRMTAVVLGEARCGKSIIVDQLVKKLGGCEIGIIDETKEGVSTYTNFFWNCSSSQSKLTFIDPHGTGECIKDIITGIFQADAVLLVIDSSKEFIGKTSALLASLLGVRRITCCLNKIDGTSPSYSKRKFDEQEKEVSAYLKEVGYNNNAITFVPISAINGENLIERSSNLH